MKRIVSGILVVLVCLSISGCEAAGDVLDAVCEGVQVKEEEQTPRVGFLNGDVSESEPEIILSENELAGAELSFSIYRSSLMYDSLEAKEKTLYRALEYAMENQYTCVLADKKLIDDVGDLPKVLNALALDSPLLEQNLRYRTGAFHASYPVQILHFYDKQISWEGNYIDVSNFAKDLWDKKIEALAQAKKIVGAMPEKETQVQKARWLYDYVGEHVTYSAYEKTKESKYYLYDGLVIGKTQCDGFANMISLLFRMAGIECAEKLYAAGENEVGHTWNICCLDGEWYNVDGTGTYETKQYQGINSSDLSFGYEDRLQMEHPEYEEVYPKCTKNIFHPIDIEAVTSCETGLADRIADVCQTGGDSSCFLLLGQYVESDMQSTIQDVANTLQRTIGWISYPVLDGKMAAYIY